MLLGPGLHIFPHGMRSGGRVPSWCAQKTLATASRCAWLSGVSMTPPTLILGESPCPVKARSALPSLWDN